MVLCPGAEFGPSKRWPESYYAQLANHYLACGWQIWIFGSPKDQEVAQAIQVLTQKRCIDLTGRTTLADAIDLMALANRVVSNDSGLMHMAAAVGTPTIGLFGPSDDRMYAPYCAAEVPINQVIRIPESVDDLKKRPDFSFNAPHTFMNNLKPEVVLQVLEKMWSQQA